MMILFLIAFAGLWSGACWLLALMGITSGDSPPTVSDWLIFLFAPITVPVILLIDWLS